MVVSRNLLLSISVLMGLPAQAADLSQHRLTSECEVGISAFTETVHKKVRTDCVLCHGDGSAIKAFANEDPKTSYYQLLNYVNFAQVDYSALVLRAGNGHCGLASCNEDSGKDMLDQVNAWWEKGEKDCQRNGQYFTEEQSLPTSLPTDKAKFVTMTWDLGSINRTLSGMAFSLEIQQFVNRTEDEPGAYRVRKPQLSMGSATVKLRDIKILTNRKHDMAANGYTYIAQTHSPVSEDSGQYPLLSSQTMILLQDLAEGDKLSVSFEDIAVAAAESCQDIAMFNAIVRPTMAGEKCTTCHGAPQVPGTEAAKMRFNMDQDEAALCAAFRQRILWEDPLFSPGLTLPLKGTFGHPMVMPQPQSTLNAFLKWAKAEMDAK